MNEQSEMVLLLGFLQLIGYVGIEYFREMLKRLDKIKRRIIHNVWLEQIALKHEAVYYFFGKYRGGKLIREFLGLERAEDSFQPEDWISSFTSAKNKDFIENEGITRVISGGREMLITDAVSVNDFGEGREESGVLIKYLDSAERLGIQVHPTKKYAREVFGSEYSKTECWHILGGREINGEKPCVYLGFKEDVTKEKWKELFDTQNIQGMLNCLHRFDVKEGDTVLVTGERPTLSVRDALW